MNYHTSTNHLFQVTKLVANTNQPFKLQLNDKLMSKLRRQHADQTADLMATLERDAIEQIQLAKQQNTDVNKIGNLSPEDLIKTETIDLDGCDVNEITVNVIDNKKIVVEMDKSATNSSSMETFKRKETTIIRDGFEIDTISSSVIDDEKKLLITWKEKPVEEKKINTAVPVTITFNKSEK